MRWQKAYWMSSDTSRRSNKAECLRDVILRAMMLFIRRHKPFIASICSDVHVQLYRKLKAVI
ncbi:hypothetical protein D3C73_1517420 [compost metagenome]